MRKCRSSSTRARRRGRRRTSASPTGSATSSWPRESSSKTRRRASSGGRRTAPEPMIATLALLTAAMRFEIASKPYVDLYFRVRSVAAGKDPVPEDSWLAEAVRAARALDAELQSPLAWGHVEARIGDCATAEEGSAALAGAPETIELPGGKTVALRA